MSEHDDNAGFKVEDHRRFDAGGRLRSDAAASDAASAAADMTQAREGAASGITFSGFVVGLATQALAFLGAGGVPGIERDLDEAAALIDVLSLLQEKTRGNLNEGENQMMEEVLYDLRMRFVHERRLPKTSQESGETS
ncbi:MAG: hypothetical protein ACI8TX_001792 [Hyphomicrobiaceae bacterium]|jgi:hypothetical protein